MSRLDEATLGTIAQRMLADYDAANPGTVFEEGLRLEIADGGFVAAQHFVPRGI
jgi:hypothetical protein